MQRAGFWRRAVAQAIDVVAAGALAFALQVAVYVVLTDSGRPEFVRYLYDLTNTGVFLAYTSSEVWVRRSPGKMLLGLVIAYPDGSRADRWTLFLRWSTKFSAYLVALVGVVTLQPAILQYLSGFMLVVVMVGCLQALDEHKRAWHDEWSRTAVFRRPHGQPTGAAPSALEAVPG